ncbi:MAG: SDR family NAD(P)-dependent oxidoreductase [Ilumatobacter sp.]|uniref:SDR family NAD(P)-dependent oxidoreductase n=2 Tax=Ilumatobacter sp. TaxID=1967498 RepID=UPI0032972157
MGQTAEMQELSGKTAVITGAASGIGLALAHRFGAAGMNLVVGDIESGPLDLATTELSDAGYDVAAMELDVSDLDGIRAFESFARESFGNVHLLCNNAGVGAGGPVADMDNLDLWKWTIDINLWGVIYGCKVFMGAMIEHGEGAHIVNTASMAGHLSAPMMGPYNISKYGVVALSETMAKEMAMMQTTLGVSVLCPAFVQTKIATSDRNLPDEVKAAHGRDGSASETSGTQSVIERLVASGIPTADVAEAVHDAVVNDEFWILTHPESTPAITERARQIVDGINPPLTGFV